MNNINLNSNYKSILIIEDNKELQSSLKTILESEGYKIVTADNGKEGIELLRKIPTPCMILLDLMMPIMNGWEFVDIVSKDIILSNIPITVISAFGDTKGTPKTNDYIPKPIDLDALFRTVRKHCG